MTELRKIVINQGIDVIDPVALELAREVAEMVKDGKDFEDVMNKAKALYEKV